MVIPGDIRRLLGANSSTKSRFPGPVVVELIGVDVDVEGVSEFELPLPSEFSGNRCTKYKVDATARIAIIAIANNVKVLAPNLEFQG